jgi:hypothetical protein
MFSYIKSLLSVDNSSKVVDGIYNGIDKAFYTTEEKAEDRIKLETSKLETKLKLLPLFEPFKIAQRVIAIGFSINFLLAFWLGTILLIFSSEAMLSKYLELVAIFNLGWIMGAIIAWYFTGGIINSTKDKK